MDLTGLIQIFTGFLGSLGFSILFNIRGRKLWVASLGGLISWTIFLLLEPVFQGEASRYFFAAAAVTVYSEFFARVLKTPTTTFITVSLIPLIPGSSLYYTMAYAFESDVVRFLDKGIDTLMLASSLALGIIVATTLTKIFYRLLAKYKKHS
jgi:uncharacterized membrane protein YjjB (DUF3815 family)